MLLSKTLEKSNQNDASPEKVAGLIALFVPKEPLLASLSKGFVAKALKLFVAISTLLDIGDYQRLVPHFWALIQSDTDASLTSSVRRLLVINGPFYMLHYRYAFS